MTHLKLREEIAGNNLGEKIVRTEMLASREDAVLQSGRNFLGEFERHSPEQCFTMD